MKYILALFLFITALGCSRIETGEVGLRVGFDKQIKLEELLPGSFNQTLIGSVITFPTKDVAIEIDNLTPQAKDNSTMKDFDILAIYSINPKSVAELYTTRNRSFHAEDRGDTYLMFHYIFQSVRNAAYKSVREYEALDVSDNRVAIEAKILEATRASLAAEKLDGSITVSQIQVRNIQPADSVVASANELVRSKNELKQKEIEVQTAKKEAERISALNANKGAVEYMNAMALQNISEGIKNGKVQTVVVPYDFKGIVNVGK